MKRLLAFFVCIVFICSFVLCGCKRKEDNNVPSNSSVKFGAGVYVGTPEVSDATEEKNGSGMIEVTGAAVCVDDSGKIVSCALDTASNTVHFTSDGKALANDVFLTKYEMGEEYNMTRYGGANREWFEQADAFESVVVGKTLDEVKALVADGGKGNKEVIDSGCTISINEFVLAVEKAYNTVSDKVKADALLKVKFATEQICSDATDEKDGDNKLSVYVFASAEDKDGKILTASSDCAEVAFTFDKNGICTLDTTKKIQSKKEQGNSYGMVLYGPAQREWFEQAEVFDKACVGKTAEEILSLADEDGRGIGEIQKAGCTINITGFVKAASK